MATCLIGHGQNLVPNPSFEVYDTCPSAVFQVHRAVGWFGANGTADYFNTCTPTGGSFSVSVPNNWVGYQQPKHGNGYMGMSTFIKPDSAIIGIREAIGVHLPTHLIPGTKYFASFYASLATNSAVNSGCGANKLGIMFSNSQYVSIGPTNAVPLHNQSQVFTDLIITDTLNWTKISGSFVSDSNYSYLYVGNFFQDSMVSFTSFGVSQGGYSYYYIDNICLSTDSLTCPISVGIKEPRQTTATIFPNPFSIQLTFKLTDSEQTTVSLYDFLGQQILQQTFTNSTTINTRHMPDGIYFYELRNFKGTLKTGKLVKQ